MTGIGRRLRAAVGVALLACVLIPGVSRAVPPGPPEIIIHAQRVHFSTTFDIMVEASDPDGIISALSVCVEHDCASTERRTDPAGEALACLHGDTASVSLRHTFPSSGTFTAVAEATGGGCPLIGAVEIEEQTYEIVVPEPPPPHGPIVCAQPGEPAASDPGVYSDRVVLGSIGPMSGPGSSFLGARTVGLRAAVRAINEMGGVCDRRLELLLTDDDGDEQRREELVRSMIESDEVFALVAVPASEFIEDLEAHGVPDVGTFGDSEDEFTSPMVWPLGAGNHAFGWIAVEEAYEAGARSFGIVYDDADPIGTETYEAVTSAVAAQGDATLKAAVPILPSRASYSSEIQAFNNACADGCDAVIMAMQPQTALTWMAGRPRQGTLRTTLHQTMFNGQYASNCGRQCQGQVAWTGFLHPIGNAPAAERACTDMRAISPTVDCADPYTLASYESVFAAAHAMGHAGVDLTRLGFQTALDANPFDIGLHGGALSWTTSRNANRWMRGYDIVIAQGSFAGWRDLTGWREDPR